MNHIKTQLHENLHYIAPSENWDSFSKKIQMKGAIAEIWVEGKGLTSPSSQGFIADDGSIFVLSTHEQILKEDSLYLGCHFPAYSSYRTQLASFCKQIGETLAKHGARERFAVDYVVVESEKEDSSSKHDIYAIEINLRSGGTTHPCETARLLCRGFYCGEKGILISCNGVCIFLFKFF